MRSLLENRCHKTKDLAKDKTVIKTFLCRYFGTHQTQVSILKDQEKIYFSTPKNSLHCLKSIFWQKLGLNKTAKLKCVACLKISAIRPKTSQNKGKTGVEIFLYYYQICIRNSHRERTGLSGSN